MQKNKSNTKSINRNIRTFLPFLFLAYLIWSLNDFAEFRIASIPINIAYKNSPLNKIQTNKLQKQLNIDVYTSGFNALKYQLFKRRIQFDLKQLNYKSDTLAYLVTQQYLAKIQEKFPTTMNVQSIRPDTLFFKYNLLATKEVPIQLNTKITYAEGFNTSDSIVLKPSTIIIYGSQKLINNINEVETEDLVLSNIKDNINQQIALMPQEGIRYNQDTIQIQANVDQIITGELSIPFQLINSTKDITTFPQQINIKYKVPVKKFKSIQAVNFKISCDYKKRKDGILFPKIIKKPSFVTIMAIEPSKIHYIINQ